MVLNFLGAITRIYRWEWKHNRKPIIRTALETYKHNVHMHDKKIAWDWCTISVNEWMHWNEKFYVCTWTCSLTHIVKLFEKHANLQCTLCSGCKPSHYHPSNLPWWSILGNYTQFNKTPNSTKNKIGEWTNIHTKMWKFWIWTIENMSPRCIHSNPWTSSDQMKQFIKIPKFPIWRHDMNSNFSFLTNHAFFAVKG